MLMARSGHKGISRIDHKKRNTHGWYVRVTFQGKTHAKLFSDSVHGGEEKALQRAIRYRNNSKKRSDARAPIALSFESGAQQHGHPRASIASGKAPAKPTK
jgi:hypothetical protein